jgi:hypothetical protein
MIMTLPVRKNFYNEYWINFIFPENEQKLHEMLISRFASIKFYSKSYHEVGMRFENCFFFKFIDKADEAAFLLWSSRGIEI